MQISAKKLRDLAQMACLKVDEEELPRLSSELQQLLDHFTQLSEMPDPEPAQSAERAQSSEATLREDRVLPGLERELLLEAAPAREGDFFRVPAVIRSAKQGGEGDVD